MHVATLGLDGIVVRELVKDESRRDELLCTAFWLKVIGAILVFLALAVAINFTSNDRYTNTLIFIIAGATVFQAFNVVDMYFQAKVMGKYIALANSISLFLSSVVKIMLIIYKAPLEAFAWAVLFDSFVLAAGYLYFYLLSLRAERSNLSAESHCEQSEAIQHSIFNIQNLTFNKKTAVSLLRDSWPLILSGLVIMIYMRIDQVMIKEMLGAEAVGQYAAVRISEAWYFVPMVISSSLFPAIINAKKVSEELYYARLQKLYNLMVWMAIAIALPMTFLSDWVVNLLYGDRYNQAGSVLMIYIWALIPVCFGIVLGSFFVIENLNIQNLIRNLLGAFINVILNYILIDIYSIKGAAYASLISFLYISLIHSFIYQKSRRNFICMLKSLMLSKAD